MRLNIVSHVINKVNTTLIRATALLASIIGGLNKTLKHFFVGGHLDRCV